MHLKPAQYRKGCKLQHLKSWMRTKPTPSKRYNLQHLRRGPEMLQGVMSTGVHIFYAYYVFCSLTSIFDWLVPISALLFWIRSQHWHLKPPAFTMAQQLQAGASEAKDVTLNPISSECSCYNMCSFYATRNPVVHGICSFEVNNELTNKQGYWCPSWGNGPKNTSN